MVRVRAPKSRAHSKSFRRVNFLPGLPFDDP